MNNSEVISAFYQGKKGKSSNNNLRSTGDKLINYATCLLQRLANGTIIGNTTKYSVSTSKIQNWAQVSKADIKVSNVSMGDNDLESYISKGLKIKKTK
jgi:hypothetical protein